jgi:hypothetical protein
MLACFYQLGANDMQASLTRISQNIKTGPIPVSMTSANSCPTACPLAGKNGCYAESGNTAIHWRNVTNEKTGKAWDQFCADVAKLPNGTLWRHNVAGDLVGNKRHIDPVALKLLVSANNKKKGFTYTHYSPFEGTNKYLINYANLSGFTINLSANNLDHADDLMATNSGPVVTLLPSSIYGNEKIVTKAGHVVVVCPATYHDNTTCSTCSLCQIRDRKTIVGFPAHGGSKKKADLIVNSKIAA